MPVTGQSLTSSTNASIPVTVSGVTDAVKIAGGYAHVCVTAAGGVVRCWGLNNYGQLGDGLGALIPPQVTSNASKSLSIAFEEIGSDKIVGSFEAAEPASETD